MTTTMTTTPEGRADRQEHGHRLSIGRGGGPVIGRCSCGESFRSRGPRGASRRSLREHHRAHVDDALDYAADLRVDCVVCNQGPGMACLGIPGGRVHGARRIRRLLAGLPLARNRTGGRA